MRKVRHDFLSNVSRLIIGVPLVVILLTLFFYFSQNSAPPKQTLENITPTREPFDLSRIDLKGPSVCNYESDNTKIQGYIKDQKVHAQIMEPNKNTIYLLNGDCLYSWSNGSRDGQKSCGLAPYLATFNLIKNTQVTIPIDAKEAYMIIDSCQKQEVANMRIFDVPKNISFTEAPLSIPAFLR